METFDTDYGKITLYKNETYIIEPFKKNSYWDIDTLLKLKRYVDPSRNILEIGGHCGTSSIIYASFLNDENKIYVYEPQKKLFHLLVKNIEQNNLKKKIIPYNFGIFCYNGLGKMHNKDLDGGSGLIEKRYDEENFLKCNFGGVCLGNDGENVILITVDSMNLDNIGFIHCDAQGAENFIFSKALDTIKKYRPVILYENNECFGTYLYKNVCEAYPDFIEESKFDLKKYCINVLNYKIFIDKFNNTIDTLLIP